jgi:hypothetical protein
MTIYSYLQGGLGNQMFQYAIARALAKRYQTDFLLNHSWFNQPLEGDTPRELQIHLLNIQDVGLDGTRFPSKPNKISRFFQKILPVKSLIIYQKRAFDYDPTLFNLDHIKNRNLYLSGYWQAYPYFQSIQEQLKVEFQTKSTLSHHYKKYLDQIQSKESVMVHIRRGDYVNSPAASQYHGVLPLNYYLSAIQDIRSKKPQAHLFIFSDDLVWAQNTLASIPEKTFIEHDLCTDAVSQELQLMISCKHHIIANSTLSWWGAWLKEYEPGSVYAPNQWIKDPNLNLDYLLPTQWKRIAVTT